MTALGRRRSRLYRRVGAPTTNVPGQALIFDHSPGGPRIGAVSEPRRECDFERLTGSTSDCGFRLSTLSERPPRSKDRELAIASSSPTSSLLEL